VTSLLKEGRGPLLPVSAMGVDHRYELKCIVL